MPLRDEPINHPLEHKWSKKSEKTPGCNAEEASQMPVQKWANLS
jgi:hypothetical protein